MNKIKIITDCTSDLPNELYSKHDIDVLPLYITIGGKTYADKVEITAEEIYNKVEEFNELPKTSTISPAVLFESFNKYIELGYDILFMGLGANLSGVYQNAMMVKEELKEKDGNIRIVDSKNLSSGIGILLLKAVKFRDQGDDLETIANKLEDLVPQVKTLFGINTLDYLHKGGRCSGTAKIFGTLLKLKPIIRVVNGKLEVAKKPRGKFKVNLDAQLNYVKNDLEKIDTDNIFITHSLADKDAVYLKNKLNDLVKINNIIESTACGVISTHCGPRTIGIIYIVNK